MLAIHQLGDARADIVTVLAALMGDAKARAFVTDLETQIAAKARAGATEAIPGIEAKVRIAAAEAATPAAKKALLPYLIGAIAAGSVGAVFGTLALVRSRR